MKSLLLRCLEWLGKGLVKIPEDLQAFADFVKGSATCAAAKHCNHTYLPFLPYGVRTLAIYIADLVRALKMEADLLDSVDAEGVQKTTDFAKELYFFAHMESVQDVGKCADQSITDAMSEIQSLAWV